MIVTVRCIYKHSGSPNLHIGNPLSFAVPSVSVYIVHERGVESETVNE